MFYYLRFSNLKTMTTKTKVSVSDQVKDALDGRTQRWLALKIAMPEDTLSKKMIGAKGYEPYEVNEMGNIRSVDRIVNCKDGDKSPRKGKIIKPFVTPFGYLRVRLSFKGKCKNAFIHRMIAETFIPNPEKRKCVNHKNGVKTDNRVENLEWATHKENTLHAYELKLMKGRYGSNNQSSRLVLNIATGIYYDCANDAAIAHNIPVKKLYKWLDGTNYNKSNLLYV